MKKKKLLIWLAACWIFLLLSVIGAATYAWFTFQPYTNVEPISSTVSSGDTALLISSLPGGSFTAECVLPQSVSGNLEPVSTADLEHFYGAVRQTRQGISVMFEDAANRVDTDTIHGIFYLQSLKDGCDVYFNRNGMDFGQDIQMLAALRLGLRISTDERIYTYIFRLDEMGDTKNASARQTTVQANAVIEGITADGAPVYRQDPALSLSDYFAAAGRGTNGLPAAGRAKLCTINANGLASVEYWLYLEGCDENCINDVQSREGYIQLSFAGVSAPGTEN